MQHITCFVLFSALELALLNYKLEPSEVLIIVGNVVNYTHCWATSPCQCNSTRQTSRAWVMTGMRPSDCDPISHHVNVLDDPPHDILQNIAGKTVSLVRGQYKWGCLFFIVYLNPPKVSMTPCCQHDYSRALFILCLVIEVIGPRIIPLTATLPKASARFRTEIKDSLTVLVAGGLGNMLRRSPPTSSAHADVGRRPPFGIMLDPSRLMT